MLGNLLTCELERTVRQPAFQNAIMPRPISQVNRLEWLMNLGPPTDEPRVYANSESRKSIARSKSRSTTSRK